MSILDAALLYGPETTYGTAGTLARAYEARVDSFERQQSYLVSRGFRAGMQAPRSDRSVAVNMGGEGSIELDWLDAGMGLLLRDLFGATSGPTLVGPSLAFETVFSSTDDGPGTSATIQWLRPPVDGGTPVPFTHVGCVATGWQLACQASDDGFARLTASFDAQDISTAVAAGTPVYPAAVPFTWPECVVSVDGSPVDFRSLSLSADYRMATGRRFLRGSELKRQPRRMGIPTYTGELQGEFADTAHYDRFVSGEVVPMSFEWTGALIEATFNHRVTVELAAVQYRGQAPAMSLEELPSQNVPFQVLHDGVNPAVKVTVVSTDTTL